MNLKAIEVPLGRGQVQLLAGLVWFPLPQRGADRFLTEKAKEAQADLYVRNPADRRLIGLARTQDGAASDQLALALAVRKHLSKRGLKTDNMLVAFELDGAKDLWYYLMVRDGMILADGDQWGSAAQIRAAFDSDAQAGGWDSLVCPSSWGHSGSVEGRLEELLADLSPRAIRPWRLRPVRRSVWSSLLRSAMLAALMALPVYGFFLWKKFDAEQQARRIQMEQQAAEEAERARLLKTEPWTNLIIAPDFAAACEQALHRIPVISGGWQLQKFSCKPEGLSLQWVKAGEWATTDQLLADHPKAVIATDGASATAAYPLALSQAAKSEDILPAAQPALHRLLDLRPLYGFELSLAPLPLDPQLQAAATAAKVVIPWAPYRVEIGSTLGPVSVAQAVDGPGFRCLSVEGTYREGMFAYKYQGVQYAKN